MNYSEFIERFANAIDGLDQRQLSPDTELCQLEEWDSLAYLVTIVMVESDYDVELKGTELATCKTIRDIADLISKKRSK